MGDFVEKLTQTWPARLARDFVSALTLPGDVASGRVMVPVGLRREDFTDIPVQEREGWRSFFGSPGSQPIDDAIERAMPLAGLVAGGAFPMPPTSALASRSASLYNPPTKTPRPFAADYPVKASADEAGRLLYDIEGRPLVAEHIAGRRMVGEVDQGLAPAQVRSVAETGTGRDVETVPRHAIEGDDGRLAVKYDDRDRIKSRHIVVADDLADGAAEKVLAHELGHLVDYLTAPPKTKSDFRGMGWGQKARDEVIEDELYAIYRDLNRPHFGPRDLGYPALEEPKELWAEAIRAYMADPNYIKSVAPKTAAAIREAVNANPRLSSHIQFNTRGGAPIGPSDRDER